MKLDFFLPVLAAAVTACSVGFNLEDNIGICTSIEESSVVYDAGGAFIECNINGLLKPEAPDEEFEAALAAEGKPALPIYSGNCFYPGDIKFIGPEADIQRAFEYACKAFERGERLGMKVFVLGSGAARRIPEGFSRDEARKQFVELCRKMGPEARKHGITVTIEPLRPQETNFINSVREGLSIVKEVDDPNIRVLADIYHMAQAGEGPDAIIEAGQYLKHCHVAETKKRTPPGDKGDDFTPYFKALKEIGYTGRIAIECVWKDFASQSGPAVAEMKKQIESIK